MISTFHNFLKCKKVYKPDEIKTVMKQIRTYFRFAYNNTKSKFFNVPCAFDIETSSFFRSTGKNKEVEKVAIMYEWTFGIFGCVIIGRTWEEFTGLIDFLVNELQLNENKRLIIYVHNLNYEFQFIRLWFEWKKVFSIDSRSPIYAITTTGIEFRCSYLLSGYGLEKLADNLKTIKLEKLIGNLDYDKIRHSKTVLTPDEIDYCVNDVKIVMAYIAEQIEQNGDIAKIPLTKTGYVRNYCRKSCFYEPNKKRKESFKRFRYMEIMKRLRLSVDEYKQLKRAFQGGFTHANPFYSGKIMTNVSSFDFTSSYPTVMIAEQFPMGSGQIIKIESREEFEKSLKLYCCLFDVEFVGLESKLFCDSYLSRSRCWKITNPTINNGRIVRADDLFTTITEQDFMIIKQFYTWDKIKIFNFRRYKKGYLPTDFIKAILKLYQDKTQLKGVDGKEVEYLNSKEMLNSCYGMSVTDIVRPEIIYTDHWWTDDETPAIDYETQIKKYNNNGGRFLFYPWGVWVTAYARRNLFTGIVEFGSDYIYSDTDSIKVRNVENHLKYFDKYNNMIRQRLIKACKYHEINPELIEPETIKGVKKCLGVWDFDGHYSRFKTLGAKRYLVEYSNDERNGKNKGKINITVSGLNKQKCVPYMLDECKNNIDNVFSFFNNDMYIPPEFTGKMTHTYIDEPRSGTVTDYTGISAKYYERSSVHLSKADYSLSISREYADYLADIREEYN